MPIGPRFSTKGGEAHIYSRGYLPTIDEPGRAQFVSFHLADSMPAEVRQRWREETKTLPLTEAEAAFRRCEAAYLDQGNGSCCLSDTRAAYIVAEVFTNRDKIDYDLHAWVVMPNHVHVLVTPTKPLASVVKGWKGTSANRINKLLGRKGSLWSREFFDRYIRDPRHFEETVKYIEWNPVKAKLCASPEDWNFSSVGRSAGSPTGLDQL